MDHQASRLHDKKEMKTFESGMVNSLLKKITRQKLAAPNIDFFPIWVWL
jgi:hypothetical protein